uniref:Uncharacterized protein n=1 Tax=Percolomonas cosmopolitus TaxID=63605 RepID=A0A7S1KUI3_9EUKA|mmetsp:Transcript_9068/g.33442  ORF Transcript_9068/g.33442 Transcript_9068/m.33442 type:complete len:329 (+) Transcript_9068:473-1459(+)
MLNLYALYATKPPQKHHSIVATECMSEMRKFCVDFLAMALEEDNCVTDATENGTSTSAKNKPPTERFPSRVQKKNTGKRKSKDSPAKKSRKKRQRVVEDVSVSHSDTTLNSAKGNAEFEDFEFPQEKYARRLTRQAAAVTAAILSHSAASSPTASSAKETIFVVHPQENTHPQDETTAQQINLQKYQGTIANHKYPHQDSSGKDSNHLHSDADDEEQMEILPKYEPPRRHRSWSRDSSSFRDVMQNFERSLEDAKEQARKRRRLSLEERETHPSVLHLIQEHYTTVPRKSKRKGAPFRAYPVDSTESSERRTASNEIYLPNAPTLYAE